MRLLPGNIKSLDPNEGQSGGVAGVGANGLPFVPNVQMTGPSSTVSQVKPTKEYLEGIQRGQTAAQDQINAINAETGAGVAAAQAESDIRNGYTPGAFNREDPFESKIAKGQAARDQEYIQERERLRAEHTQRVKQAHEQYDERFRQAVDAQNIKGFWDDKSAEQKSMARLGVWISAFGAGISGGENKALAYIKDEVKQDAERKAARAQRLMQLAEQSKGALADAYRQRAEELSDFDLNYAAGLKVLSDQAALYAKTMLPAQLQAQGAQKVAALQADAAKAYQDAHEKLNTRIESQSGHDVVTVGIGGQGGSKGIPSTEETKQGAMAESNMEDARRLRKLDDEGWAPSPELANKILDRQNVLMANQKKEGESAFRSFLGQIARGGGMPDSIFPKETPPQTREWWNLHMGTGHAYAMDKFRGNSWISEYEHTVAPFLVGRGETKDSIHTKNTNLVNHVEHIGERVQEASKLGAREKMLENASAQPQLPAFARKRLGLGQAFQKQPTQPEAATAPTEPAKSSANPVIEKARAALQVNPNNAKAKRVLELAGERP